MAQPTAIILKLFMQLENQALLQQLQLHLSMLLKLELLLEQELPAREQVKHPQSMFFTKACMVNRFIPKLN